MKGLLGAALASLLLLAAPAGASTLRATSWQYEYTAAPGEANDVTVRVSRIGPSTVRTRLRDEGATIGVDAPPGVCEVVDEHEVECFGSGRVLTGDGNDRVRGIGEESFVAAWLGPGEDVATSEAGGGLMGEEGDDRLTGGTLEGGEGADRLTLVSPHPRASALGGPGDDVITGTAMRDVIDAGPGVDRVAAGEGDDEVTDVADGASSGDDLDGGGGRDVILLSGRSPVSVDLAAGAATSGGDSDHVRAFEGVITGGGDDVLIGGPGPDVLSGGQGDDRLDGGPGDDLLMPGWGDDVVAGGPGDDALDGDDHNEPTADAYGPVAVFREPDRDVLDGGDGNDRLLTSGDRWVDRVECGAGADGAAAETVDLVEASCETVERRPLPSLFQQHRIKRGPRVSVTGRIAAIEVPCAVPSIGGNLVLRRGGRVIGRRSWRCVPDPNLRLLEPSHGLRVGLDRRTTRRLRRQRRLRVTIEMGWDDGSVPSRERVLLVR